MFKKLAEIRNNVLISKRLKALVVTISVLIVLLGFISVRNISNINSKINEINEVYLKSMVKLSGLIENIYSVLIESHIIDEKSFSDNTIDNTLNVDLLDTYLTEYEHSIVDDTQKSLYDGFVLEFQNYVSILKEVNSLELKEKYELAKQIKLEREITSFRKLQSIVQSMMLFNADGIRNSSQMVNKLEQQVLNQIYFISGLVLILTILITTFLIKDINGSIKLLISNLQVLKKGEIPEKSLLESKNEIGLMAGLTNSVTNNLAALNRFATDISKGNYSTEYKLSGDNDLLGKVLVNLRNNLRVSKEEDKRRKIEEERRNWTNKGHALFGEILRQRSRGVTQLTDDIIKNLIYYLKANQGGLFLINDSSETPKIELVSAFAYDRKKFFDRSINIGDGLIGTVALERNTIYLKEIPEDYIEIESGLGDASPKSLLIVPLKFEDDILGIVEIASFKEFEKYEIKFVEEAAQSIASTLLTAKINARTEQLLDESRKQSEELTAQEIEARQNMEEMRATQELAERREAALSGILSAVDNTLMKGEYELDGTLISVNNRHLQTMGYQLKEIKGKNIEIFIPKDELEHFRKVWASVVAGNPRQLEVRRRTKTGEVLWLINQYTPVTDISGKISRVLYLAHDITEYKKSKEELAVGSTAIDSEKLKEKLKQLNTAREEVTLKSNELSSILNTFGSEQVIIEFDLDGKITKTNTRFENLCKTEIGKLQGKKVTQLFKLDKSQKGMEDIWTKVLAGSPVNLVNKYTLKDDHTFWLKEYYTPILNADKLVYKVISIAVDITQLKLAEEKNKNLQKKIETKISPDDKAANIEKKEYGDIINSFNQTFPRVELAGNMNFIAVNDAFSNKFKYTLKELKAKPITRIVDSESKEILKEKLDKIVLGVVQSVDLDIKGKDNANYRFSLKIIPVGNESIEKIIVYFVEKLSVEATGEYPEDKSQKIIEDKKKELEQIEAKIKQLKEQTKQKTENYIDSATDELYNQWLNKLKDIK